MVYMGFTGFSFFSFGEEFTVVCRRFWQLAACMDRWASNFGPRMRLKGVLNPRSSGSRYPGLGC